MSRADHHANATRVLRQAIASALYPDNLAWSEEDIATALMSRGWETSVAVAALMVIVDAACEEAVGEIVDRIRKAEGVDTAAVDAALGVEPEEDDRYDSDEVARDPFKVVDH